MPKKRPRPRPLSGAGRGKGPGARIFRCPVRPVTNSNHNQPDRQKRTALTRRDLLITINHLGGASYDDIVLQASFTLAFAGFLRVGEFTYRQIDQELGFAFQNWFLTKSSISLSDSRRYIELSLPASKTDPFRHCIQLIIAACDDQGCPVAAMRRLMHMDTHRPPGAFLFCIGRRGQYTFTREYVVQKLQELAIRGGLGGGTWNEHSFRRGAATWAAEVAIAERQIQALGRWRSEAYKTYIEYSKEERIALSHHFQHPRAAHL